MSTRQFVTKSGDTFEWEETKEVEKALKAYWKTVKKNQSTVEDSKK